MMLLFFSVFLYYTVGDLLRQRADHPVLDDSVSSDLPDENRRVAFPRDSLLTLVGFGSLLYGAGLTVEGAIAVARHFEIPEVVIGMAVVAIGTSLPELTAGLIATLRGHMELAIGTVVGSNVFNLLLVLAITICIRPLEIPEHGMKDLFCALGLSIALLVVSMTNDRRILRVEAGLLLTVYIAYLSWRAAAF